MPKTKFGKWSLQLMGLFLGWIILFIILIATGQKGGETFFSNLWLTIPFILAGLSAILSMIIGIMAIFKQNEKSWLVYLSSFIGFFVALFLIAELIWPH